MKANIILTGIVAAIVGSAAWALLGGYNVAADDPHWRVTEQLLDTARDRSIAARTADIAVPPLDDAADIRTGAGNYDAMCANCHLRPGEETSELRAGLNPRPPRLTGFAADPKEAFWVIRHGIKMAGMPAWAGHMDENATWQVVAFLQQLPKLSPDDYHELVEASGGHHHGGPEGEAHEHDESHEAAEAHEEGEVHVHADGTRHVHHHANVGDAPAAVVDRFYAALSAGDLKAAGSLLDPDALILESGGAEHSAAEYLAGHAKEDAAFLKGAKYTITRRAARVDGDLAWVGSEGTLAARRDGKPVELATSETMVLKKGADGWKIAHIHWSSRARKAGEAP